MIIIETFIKNARKREIPRPEPKNLGYANIKIVGCGGAGNNTIDRLMKIGIQGAKCVAINTDRPHALNFPRSEIEISPIAGNEFRASITAV